MRSDVDGETLVSHRAVSGSFPVCVCETSGEPNDNGAYFSA